MRLRYDQARGVELLGTGLALTLIYTFNAAMASHSRLVTRHALSQHTAMPPMTYRSDGSSSLVVSPLSTETLDNIKKLWQRVERVKPVKTAHVTKVVDAPSRIDVSPGAVRRATAQSSELDLTGSIANLKFPRDFMWGTANAAAQVEGAVKADNRGPSVWDSFAHLVPGGMLDDDTFDIATNFRYLYKVDIARVRAMGAQVFSFSFSWSRVIPLGTGEISRDGLTFYGDVINEILGDKSSGNRPMVPVATLFHWDLPLQLEISYGGMTSERFVEDFVQYASIIFKAYGKSGIKMWFTFDEPQVWCKQRYKLVAPHVHGKNSTDDGFQWQCAANLLRAHGRVYRLFKQMQGNGAIDEDAQISYKNSGSFNAPLRPGNADDEAATQRVVQFDLGLFSEPVHKTGNWPELITASTDKALLPNFTKEEMSMIRGSADFFATDFYDGGVSKATEQDGGFQACIKNTSHVAWPRCTDKTDKESAGFVVGEPSDPLTPWLVSTPTLLRPHLKQIHERWPTRGGIYIAEIGWAESGEQNKTSISDIRNDKTRQNYFRDHLSETLLAIKKDGIPVRGVMAWSATCNVEWEVGLQPRFGIQTVNYTDPMLPRTFLGSFFLIRDFFAKHS